jgi:hypothetical protein
MAELAACEECAALLDAKPPPTDVVESTLGALASRGDWGAGLDDTGRRAYLATIERACAAWDEEAARDLAGRNGSQIVTV